MDNYLVSQRQAAQMLRDCGLSRRAAYYRLDTLPSRILVESKVYSRIDVELLCEQLKSGVTSSQA
jgi:hypothetical protein